MKWRFAGLAVLTFGTIVARHRVINQGVERRTVEKDRRYGRYSTTRVRTVCTYVLQTVQHHFKSLKTYSTKIFLMNKNEANNPSLILLHTSLCAVVSTIADSHPEAEGHLGKNKGTRT